MDELRKCILPSEPKIRSICEKAKEILIREPNVINLNPPISVCGDIHGQFHDLLELFEFGDYCPETSYLFLGDYVDRGYHGVEVILYLLCIKIKHPTKMTLLRGNHESRSATNHYGFYSECLKKFGTTYVYNLIMEVFDLLPITAVIGDKIFCVHGGISPDLNQVNELHNLNRKKEIPSYGIINDLMWSDPEDDVKDWEPSSRGAGYLFGSDQVKKFNHTNDFNLIVRSHQLQFNGYQYMFDESLCIIWSAPNYCYSCGNVAAILEIDEHLNIKLNFFNESPNHEYVKEGLLDISQAYFL